MIYFISAVPGIINYFYTLCKDSNNNFKLVGDQSSLKFYHKLGIKDVLLFSNITDIRSGLIVTGSYWQNILDIEASVYFREKGLKIISIIDHWSLYKERFTINNYSFNPDFIILNDTIAYEEAVQSGLPSEILKPLGNPVLDYLSKVKLNESKLEFLKYKKNYSEVITFISENYYLDFNKHSDHFQGFDEFEILNDIIYNKNKNQILFIKLHPHENENKYSNFTKRDDVIIYNDKDSIIKFSDFIIGMESFFLFEASVFRNDIITYRPKQKKDFVGNKLGITYLCKSSIELSEILNRKIKINNKNFNNIYNGSIDRIWNFINNQCN